MDKNIEDNVNNMAKDTQAEMTADLINSKAAFADTYKKVLQVSTDSTINKKLTTLYLTINETSEYIDSLQNEISKLDNKDLNNNELIKKIFLTDGIGDKVFTKVKSSYNYVIDITLADTMKTRLINARDIYSTETKNQLFGLNSPGGVNAILYGIESELIKDGTKSLNAYKTN